jgi:PadR family transcriptional regulator
MDINECPCSGKTLGKLLQPAIMTILSKEAMHGYRITRVLADMAMFCGQTPDATGVYRMLKTMESRGLVKSNWDLSDTGPARRRFELTKDGEICLNQWIKTLQNYKHAIESLLSTATIP